MILNNVLKFNYYLYIYIYIYMTEEFINYIKNKTPFIYAKFGDGEYLCIIKYRNNNPSLTCNCDNDTYTEKLSNSVFNSLKYLVNNTNNCYIGKWFDINIVNYFQNNVDKSINFIHYHTMLFDDNDLINNNICHKLNVLKTINSASQKKIYVCNDLLIKVKSLLNIDYLVHVPTNNWFDTQFNNILEQIKNILGNEDGNHIILTSCGMGAKVLIMELHKIYPNGIYIDIGSGLDMICTKRNSRGWGYNYKQLYNKFVENDFIPNDWNDSKYDYIYPEARNKLGLHISKDI